MFFSTRCTRVLGVALAAAVGSLAAACGDTDADPLVGVAELPSSAHHKDGHDGGPVGANAPVLTILSQPDVQLNPFTPGNCTFHYSFQVDKKGQEVELTWRTLWWGGEHDGANFGENQVIVGSKIGPVVVSPTPGHGDHGHAFDALRIQLLEGGDVVAEADTEGRTISCS